MGYTRIGQYQKLLAYHQAELEYSDGAIREIARFVHHRGTAARGLRAVIEGMLEPLLFDPEPWATYVVTEESVRGGTIRNLEFFGLPAEIVKPAGPVGPLRHRMGRRRVVKEEPSSCS